MAALRGPSLIGRRGYWLLGAAAAVEALSAAAIPLLGDYHPPAPGSAWSFAFVVSTNVARAVAAVTFAVVPVLALPAAGGVGRAVLCAGWLWIRAAADPRATPPPSPGPVR